MRGAAAVRHPKDKHTMKKKSTAKVKAAAMTAMMKKHGKEEMGESRAETSYQEKKESKYK